MTEDEPLKVRLLKRGYTFYIHIPKEILKELGLLKGVKGYAQLMAREVYLDKTVAPHNPFAWEIHLKPLQDVSEAPNHHKHQKGGDKKNADNQ